MADESASDGGLCFITSASPADFKSKKNMTIVRKKAMDSFLKEKKSTGPPERSRLNSEASDASRSSNGSKDARTKVITLPTATAQQPLSQADQLSSTSSPATSRHDAGDSSPEMQIIRVKKSLGSVLPPPPIVLPMRTNVILPYDEFSPAPLVSIGKSLDPFRTMFQSNNPHISVEELKWHCSRYFGSLSLGQHWIPTIVSHPHTFLSTLCLASSHHDIIHEKPMESSATTALRQEIIYLLGQNLVNTKESIADHNIVALTQLISGEIIGREEMGLVWHEAGMETMITQRGGLNQLGVNGHLASTSSWVTLVSAILREAKPRSMYADYCLAHSSKRYPHTLTIPESPIFRPHDRFVTLQRSNKCQPLALKLINDIWMMIDIFLHETKQSCRNSQTLLNLHKRITNDYVPISELRKTNVLTEGDWKYEAIRITAIIQATAIMQRIPLSEALEYAAPSRKSASLYASSAASLSNDSIVSPVDVRYDIPVTEYSTSPSHSIFSTSSSIPQSDFSFSSQGPSFSSAHTAFSAPRSSFSSTYSSSSELLFFPPPPAPAASGSSSLLRALKDALSKSNLSDCWADMAGVLAWIGYVMGAASRKNEHKLLKNTSRHYR